MVFFETLADWTRTLQGILLNQILARNIKPISLDPRFGSMILGIGIFSSLFNMVNEVEITLNSINVAFISKGFEFDQPTSKNEVSYVAHPRLELVLALCLLPSEGIDF